MDDRTGAVRDLTEQEVARYRDDGWAFLPGLVDPDVVATLRDDVRALPRPRPKVTGRSAHQERLFLEYQNLYRTNDTARAISLAPAMGRNASRLIRNGAPGRLFIEEAMAKEAHSDEAACLPTTFHQDNPAMPFDRSGTHTYWIALGPLTPEMGTLRFRSGSHRFGDLGRAVLKVEDDLHNQQPWLQELALSEPLTLEPGDATVHDAYVVHGSGANTTDRPRWSYVLTYFPSDALFTGAPYRMTNGLNLQINEPIEHENFPLLATKGAFYGAGTGG